MSCINFQKVLLSINPMISIKEQTENISKMLAEFKANNISFEDLVASYKISLSTVVKLSRQPERFITTNWQIANILFNLYEAYVYLTKRGQSLSLTELRQSVPNKVFFIREAENLFRLDFPLSKIAALTNIPYSTLHRYKQKPDLLKSTSWITVYELAELYTLVKALKHAEQQAFNEYKHKINDFIHTK